MIPNLKCVTVDLLQQYVCIHVIFIFEINDAGISVLLKTVLCLL